MPRRTRSSISSRSICKRSPRTWRVCSPSRGAGVKAVGRWPSMRQAVVPMGRGPTSGWSTLATKPRSTRCSSASRSSESRTSVAATPARCSFSARGAASSLRVHSSIRDSRASTLAQRSAAVAKRGSLRHSGRPATSQRAAHASSLWTEMAIHRWSPRQT